MASKNVFRILWFSLALLLAGLATASAEGRHALVVGINDYAHVAPLRKAVNDARAMDKALTAAGFKVQLVEGPDQIGFLEAIAKFSASVGPGDEAVVYYAGHGVEIDGQNYLLPADVPAAAAGQEIVLTNRSISVQDLVDALQARGARMSLLILDACRDNPFPRSGTRSIGGTRGLAPAPKAEGTFILYSAGEGETALDRLSDGDPNPNSVFTRALVPLISEPGLPLREVSRRVRSDVRQMAMSVDHAQFPAVYDQLDGDFSFTMASAELAVVADPCAAARADWALVAGSNDVKVIEGFLAAYPGCPVLVALAEGRLGKNPSGQIDVPPSAIKEKDDGQTDATCTSAATELEVIGKADTSALVNFVKRFPDCGALTTRARIFIKVENDKAGISFEKALKLSKRQLAHIALALRASGNGQTQRNGTEADVIAFEVMTRTLLEKFSEEKGLTRNGIPVRYLDQRLVDILLATEVSPLEAAEPKGSGIQTSGFWTSSVTDQRCELHSAAQSISGDLIQAIPTFRASALLTGTNNGMWWEMVEPLPFDLGKPFSATVDGKSFGLRADGGAVAPQLTQDGKFVDSTMIGAMRRGSKVRFDGTNVLTGEPLSITYSLDGFTAAFERMASLCNRPELLSWIR